MACQAQSLSSYPECNSHGFAGEEISHELPEKKNRHEIAGGCAAWGCGLSLRPMRTAADFNSFYSAPDPWRIGRFWFRDRVLRHRLANIIRNKRILELGCGEGHLTEAIFAEAGSVIGVDISDVAINRAQTKRLPHARFECGDMLRTSFEGFDVITALECIYYLSPKEQAAFFEKVAREHKGKTLIISTPIIGRGEHRQYFTHAELTATFDRLGATARHHNIIVRRRGLLSTLAAALARLPGCLWLLDLMRERYVFQRLYIIRMM